MFANEAKWIMEQISSIPLSERYPILNIGSNTLLSRKKGSPSVFELLFSRLESEGKVIHTDIQTGEGIDISGDLTDNAFVEKLKELQPSLILCNNLLEHIENPQRICDSILKIAPKGSYILLSVPYRYPYHYDPIDTMFRPSPEELHKMFPGTTAIVSAKVSCTRRYFDKLKNDKRLAAIIFIRSFLPFYKPTMWWNTVSYLPNMFRKFQVSCILLKKD
jgi:SAM-dependent methyltransferase